MKRIASACDMLTKGKRRPCCFDRSGMYAKSLGCPVADVTSSWREELNSQIPPEGRARSTQRSNAFAGKERHRE